MFSVFFLLLFTNTLIDIVECLSVQNLALGACLTHNGLEKCHQILRKVKTPLHVHEQQRNINCIRVFLFFYGFCKCWGQGVKVSVSVSHVEFFSFMCSRKGKLIL